MSQLFQALSPREHAASAASRVGIALLAFFSLAASTALAAEALAALVPDDPGLVLEIKDLARHMQTVPAMPLYQRMASYPPWSALAAKALADIGPKAARIRADLGAAPGDLAAKVFGGDVLFAVWPAHGGQPDQAMLLVRAPDRAMLEQVRDHIVDEQRKADKLQPSQPIDVAGETVDVYSIRVKNSQPPAYLAVYHDLGIMAGSAALVERVLHAETNAALAEKSLSNLPAYKAARGRLNPAALVRIFLNPRPWDEQMAAAPQAKQGGERLIRQAIAGVWKSSDYLAAALTLADDARFELFWACDGSALKPPLRQVGESISGQQRLLDRVPDDALAVGAARLNVGLIVKTLLSAGEHEGRWYLGVPDGSWGTTGLLTLLSGLGPDWAVFVTPSSGDGEPTSDRSPIGWLVAVATQPLNAAADGPPLAESLEPLVRSALSIAAATNNARPGRAPAKVTTIDLDGLKLTSISGIRNLAAGQELCFTQSRGLVWAGTSRQRVRQAATAAAGSPLMDHPRVKPLHHPALGQPTDVLFIDAAGLRRVLADLPRAAEMLAAAQRLELQVATRQLEELQSLLKVADTLLVEATIDSSGAACSLRLAVDP